VNTWVPDQEPGNPKVLQEGRQNRLKKVW